MRVVVTDAVGTVMYANPVNPPSSDDHGNSCATATSVSINSTLSGFLSPTSDVDFFRFTLSANTTITAVANSVFDSKGTLYDGNCNVITEDDDSAGNLDFRLQRTLTAGTYKLSWYQHNDGRQIGPINAFDVRVLDPGEPLYVQDPNTG